MPHSTPPGKQIVSLGLHGEKSDRGIAIKSLQAYTTVIRPDSNGTFVAYVPAIPGCYAWGTTSDQVKAELVHVFEMIQEENSW